MSKIILKKKTGKMILQKKAIEMHLKKKPQVDPGKSKYTA